MRARYIGLPLLFGCVALFSLLPFPARSALPPIWARTNLNNHGGSAIDALQSFGGSLYASTEHSEGARLWRLQASTWTEVMSGGFGNAGNYAIDHLLGYGGMLYAATWNEQTGGEIWRSANGDTWEQVVTGGFGDPSQAEIFRLAIFKGAIYAGTLSYAEDKGAQIWRSATGNRGSWTRVVNNGFGDPGNAAILCLQEFNGYLYAGTGNLTTGGEVWRSADGSRWSQENLDGFGSSCSQFVSALAVFNNRLYASVTRTPDCGGAQVWRCQVCDNSDWQKVVDNGFGNADNRGISALEVFDGQLYFFVGNSATGMEVWRTSNGTQWEQVGFAGFGNAQNRSTYYDNSVAVYNSKLYAGVVNFAGGADVWVYPVYLPWQLHLPLLQRN